MATTTRNSKKRITTTGRKTTTGRNTSVNRNTTNHSSSTQGHGTATLSMEEKIGFSAGEIYNYLYNNGTTSFSKIKKDLDLNGNFADLGLGWLARENKVDIQQKGPAVKVSLK